MASRAHRALQNYFRANPTAAFTTVDLLSVIYPDEPDAVSNLNRRFALTRTLRRMVFPAGWAIREPVNQRLPHVIYNVESPEC